MTTFKKIRILIFQRVFVKDIGHLMNLEDPEKFNFVLNKRIEELQ
ncbi:MAG: hypothetical protein ACFE95_08260 [Candidatus Hodarchaeota archaeon]